MQVIEGKIIESYKKAHKKLLNYNVYKKFIATS